MGKIGGRQVEIGIGIELTPGTPVAAADYFKWDSFSFTGYSDKGLLKSARGIRNQNSNSLIMKQYGKGSLEFVPTVDILPYILGLALGSRSSATHSGESAVYDHTFTIQNANASMKTATLAVKAGGVQTEQYANCVIDSFDLTIEKDFAKCKIGVLGAYPTSSTLTPSYTQDTMFSRNQMFAVFGANLTACASTAAVGTITSTGVFGDGETVTIGGITYTAKTALTNGGQTPYEFLIGGSASISLDNLKTAINGNGTAGTTMGYGTNANPSVRATTKTTTTLLVQALQPGTGGNAIPTTETAANFAWGAATLASGAGNNPTPLQAFSLNIANNVLFDEAFLSGAATPIAGGFVAGALMIKGSYTLQFADVVEYQKYLQNTQNAMIVTINGALLGTVPTSEQIVLKLGRLVLTKTPLEFPLDGIMLVKQEFEVAYDGTDKELTAVVTNNYVGTNYQ